MLYNNIGSCITIIQDAEKQIRMLYNNIKIGNCITIQICCLTVHCVTTYDGNNNLGCCTTIYDAV